FLQPLHERIVAGAPLRVVVGQIGEHADAPHALTGLRPRRERARWRASEQRDEVAPSHSITSSARASNVGGTVRPSALAVARLTTNSYLFGACTGRGGGVLPL